MVAKLWPSSDCIALSALRSNVAADDERALNRTFPLDNRVRTSEKPSASKHFFSSGILAFMGLTPRRNATYRGMGFDLRSIRVAKDQLHILRGRVRVGCMREAHPNQRGTRPAYSCD